jgi:hypothetical protein
MGHGSSCCLEFWACEGVGQLLVAANRLPCEPPCKKGPARFPSRPWGCPAWLARRHRSDESIEQVHRELGDIEIGRLAKLDHGRPTKYERGSETARSRTAASHLLCKGTRDGPRTNLKNFRVMQDRGPLQA